MYRRFVRSASAYRSCGPSRVNVYRPSSTRQMSRQAKASLVGEHSSRVVGTRQGYATARTLTILRKSAPSTRHSCGTRTGRKENARFYHKRELIVARWEEKYSEQRGSDGQSVEIIYGTVCSVAKCSFYSQV